LLALDERQGRGVDQDPPARVGVSLRLPDEHAPRPSSRRLPQVVQPTATARLARSPTRDQPCLTRLWSVQLASARSDLLEQSGFYSELPCERASCAAIITIATATAAAKTPMASAAVTRLPLWTKTMASRVSAASRTTALHLTRSRGTR